MEFIVEKALRNVPEHEFEAVNQANIKVIGVGGAGNNMVGWLYKKGIKGAEILAVNTDQQHLNITDADHRIAQSVRHGLCLCGYGGGNGNRCSSSSSASCQRYRSNCHWNRNHAF